MRRYFYQLQIIIARCKLQESFFSERETREFLQYKILPRGGVWMEMDGMRVRAVRGLPPEEKKASTEKKTHCISNPPCTFYNHCVYLLQERKFLASPSSKNSPFLTRDPLLEQPALTLSFWWKNFLPEISTPLRLTLCDSLLTIVRAFYFTWRNTSRYKKINFIRISTAGPPTAATTK